MGFNTSIIELGGMEHLAKTPLSRNLWAIAKQFNVLPSDDNFQKLTVHQINWIISNMGRDADLQAKAAKGININNMYESADTDWWDKPSSEFDPTSGLEDGEEQELAKQVEALTQEKDKVRLAKIGEDTEEWADFLANGGKDIRELETDAIIQDKLQQALEEAKRLEKHGIDNSKGPSMSVEEKEANETMSPLNKETIDDAIALFEGTDDFDIDTGSPDDGYI